MWPGEPTSLALSSHPFGRIGYSHHVETVALIGTVETVAHDARWTSKNVFLMIGGSAKVAFGRMDSETCRTV